MKKSIEERIKEMTELNNKCTKVNKQDDSLLFRNMFKTMTECYEGSKIVEGYAKKILESETEKFLFELEYMDSFNSAIEKIKKENV